MGSAMRELKVEDALLYLDQVKVEFGDQPHIYNEFLDIMKTFKTQQIDTPGVIQRVSNLFRGNRRLVLGFNTFLPEGYKIELPEGDGPAVAVYRAPGSNVAHILTDSSSGPPRPPVPAQMRAQQPSMRQALPPVGQRGAREPPYQSISGGPQAPQLRGPGVQSQHDGPQQRALHVMDQQQGRQGPGGIMSRQAPVPSLSSVSDSNDMKMRINGPSLSMSNEFAGGKPVARSLSPSLPSIQQQAPPPLSQASQQPPAGATAPPSQQGPLEFDHAINYVTTIKKRFASEPYTYKKFLEILHTYQKEQRGIKEVLDEVSTLFADHPDLLKEFTYFLPDAVQAQAKAQLEQVAKEAEARNALKAKKSAAASQAPQPRQSPSSAAAARAGPAPRASAAAAAPQSLPPDYDRAGSAIVPVGFSGSHGRSPGHENSIIRGAHFGIVSFSPVRPPRKSDLTPAQAAIQKGRPTAIPPLPMSPNTAETSFFQRAKEHLNRRELAPDKPTGSKRHTPFTEFLKCLHLFGAGILNKEELVLLLKGLFMQGHAPKSGANASGGNFNPSVAQDANELLREFEEILIGRGPYAQQETEFKDKSKYGALRTKDFDFTGCEHPTPSYRTYPCDYPQSLFNSHPGQSEMEAAVLNSNVVCVGTKNGSFRTIEDCNGSMRRHNIYEEAMFQIEDERFEVDMAIERNAQAMGQIEPFAEEVQALREQEEKDGQPIGRLQYQLNRYAMNTIHINAIGRVYGERGDEVLQHLVENPYIVLPIIYQRLKQKDTEWKKVKAGLLPKWRALVEENYEGTLDALCYFKRLDVERMFNFKVLLDECKRAQTYAKHPERIKVNQTTQPFIPNFRLINTDPGAFLCQPHVLVHCPVTSSHKDAMQLVSHHVRLLTASRPLDRERISRIWAEFIVPWFNYPAHWVVNQVRPSFGDTFGPHVVKYALGQRVATLYGEGMVVSMMERGLGGPKYRVQMAFGMAYLSPSAILYAVPSKDHAFVRRDGAMVRDELLANAVSKTVRLDEKYEMLFGTENIYLFLRLYALLSSFLSDIRTHCENYGTSEDPSEAYRRPLKKDSERASSPKRLDYFCALEAVEHVVSKKMGLKELETLGRKVSKEKVHLIAALPKLVESCTESLVAIASEDVLLQLYDYCNYRKADPVVVRAHCFSVAPQASYRIQYDTTAGILYFSYLPKGRELRTASPGQNGNIDSKEMNGDDVPMESEDDPIEEFDDEEYRVVKRAKVQ